MPTEKKPTVRCTFDASRDGNPCGRTMMVNESGGATCRIHDRLPGVSAGEPVTRKSMREAR